MSYIVLFFLVVSLLFYLLFGGADFGAGILELFSRQKNRKATADLNYKVIGPVWEANHIWLIIVIVILWTGFPKIYSQLSINLHIPLLIMLVGIITRGTSFIFRHYDAVIDESQKLYTKLFTWSSLITPLFIGIIAGSLTMGRMTENPSSFYEGYVAPWFNGFSISVGFFMVSISAFLAAVYLIAESKDSYTANRMIAKTKFSSVSTVLAGFLVFATAHSYELPLFERFISNPAALTFVTLATISLPLFWYFLRKGKFIAIRLFAGFQVSMITFAWLAAQYPVVIFMKSTENLSLENTIANERSIELLAWALMIAGVLILPGLYHLMKSFDMIKILKRKK